MDTGDIKGIQGTGIQILDDYIYINNEGSGILAR